MPSRAQELGCFGYWEPRPVAITPRVCEEVPQPWNQAVWLVPSCSRERPGAPRPTAWLGPSSPEDTRVTLVQLSLPLDGAQEQTDLLWAPRQAQPWHSDTTPEPDPAGSFTTNHPP